MPNSFAALGLLLWALLPDQARRDGIVPPITCLLVPDEKDPESGIFLFQGYFMKAGSAFMASWLPTI